MRGEHRGDWGEKGEREEMVLVRAAAGKEGTSGSEGERMIVSGIEMDVTDAGERKRER